MWLEFRTMERGRVWVTMNEWWDINKKITFHNLSLQSIWSSQCQMLHNCNLCLLRTRHIHFSFFMLFIPKSYLSRNNQIKCWKFVPSIVGVLLLVNLYPIIQLFLQLFYFIFISNLKFKLFHFQQKNKKKFTQIYISIIARS